MTDFSALPQWRCHKVVRAAKIASTQEMHDRWYVDIVDIPGLEGLLSVDPTVFARGVPEQGDYLVVYRAPLRDGAVTIDAIEKFTVFTCALAIIVTVSLSGLAVFSTTSSLVWASIAEGVAGISCVVALNYALDRDWLP